MVGITYFTTITQAMAVTMAVTMGRSHNDRVQGPDGRKETEHRTGHVRAEAATIPIYKYIIWSPVLWPQDVSDPCTVFF